MSRVIPNSPDMKPWQLPEMGDNKNTELPEKIRSPEEEEGYLRGLDEGLIVGREKAYQDAKHEAELHYQQQIQQKQQKITDILHILQKPMLLVDAKVEQEIMNLITKLVTRLCRNEMSANPKIIQTIVLQALQLLPIVDQHVTICASTQDIDRVREIIDNLEDRHCDIKEDPELQLGDIQVHTQYTEIDASVSARLYNLLEQITDHESANEITAASAKLSD